MNTEQSTIVVGAPLFNTDPYKSSRFPLGQKSLMLRVIRETTNPTQIFRNMALEHVSIVLALRSMGFQFQILLSGQEAAQSQIADIYGRIGTQFINCPQLSTRHAGFPRDIATSFSSVTFISDELSGEEKSFVERITANGKPTMRSPYGQGGRVLSRKNVALISAKLWREDRLGKLSITTLEAQTEDLRRNRIRFGLLPDIVVEESNSRMNIVAPEDHIDFTAGLLEDQRGNLHLIVDPKWHSGFTDPFAGPRFGPKETIERVRSVCEKLEITLHVPKTLTVPLSIGFVQFENGHVLMTGGDDNVAEIVANIIGSEKVHQTEIPIQHYPVWSNAGVHCIIGQFAINT